MSSSKQERKAKAVAALHIGEPFVLPNPWDAGSAGVLEALGFRALATTSSGLAFTLGRLDGGATLYEVCRHVAELDRATELPISADLENGYGSRPEDAAEIRAVCEAVSKPVNVLAVSQLTVMNIVAAGAQRISTGGFDLGRSQGAVGRGRRHPRRRGSLGAGGAVAARMLVRFRPRRSAVTARDASLHPAFHRNQSLTAALRSCAKWCARC